MGKAGPPQPLPDNGVPGPGTYQDQYNYPVPSFKIAKET